MTLKQVHSNDIWNAEGIGDREEQGDALLTSRVGQAIGVRTADCVPILLLDTATRAVAAVHAGWRGTAAQIASRTVENLRREFGSEPANLYAAMGPSIRVCCYEVSSEVAVRFATWPESVVTGAGAQPRIDLAGINRAQLKSAGVSAARIFDSELCTCCSGGQFFSYRREPANPGRMLSVISRIA